MKAFDASSMIHAWDQYPSGQFPGMWEWMAEQVESGEFVMLAVAFDEVAKREPDCAKWLEDHALQRTEVSNSTLENAIQIQGLLGIENDQYGIGVGENDILIISSAKEHNQELISDENRQQDRPENMKKYKIPAVCAMDEVAVPCINFIELIKRSKEVFR